MNAIQFTTVIGPDGVIHPPTGVSLPEGEFDVSLRPHATPIANLEARLQALCDLRGLNPANLSDRVRAILMSDLAHEDRGTVRPLPGPGALKGSILYMAPDFDAPLEDMKEYME